MIKSVSVEPILLDIFKNSKTNHVSQMFDIVGICAIKRNVSLKKTLAGS